MSRTSRNATLHAFARELRRNMTDAEQCLWRALRHKQISGIKFRRQWVIGQYIVDFVSTAHRLVIELDGGQHASQQDYDEQRSAFLHSQGYRVLRFWNHEVLQQTDAVAETIMQYCQTPPPRAPGKMPSHFPGSAHPSPASRGGDDTETP